MYIIEGLDNVDGVPPGSFAVLQKTHHAAIDGVASQELQAVIHDLTPDYQEAAAPPPTRGARRAAERRGDAGPGLCELGVRAPAPRANSGSRGA